MKLILNQKVNIDNIEKYLYNNIKIFNYKDYLTCQEIFYTEKNIIIREDYEKYKRVNNEHDKVFRTILDDRKEAISFINKVLKVNLEENQIEKYKENYITENLINKETDIVYKVKNKKVFILIEHQTKIDYAMPYRIMQYQYKIINSAIDKNKLGKKDYKIPIVIPIVLYTGRKKWNVKKYIKEVEESFGKIQGLDLGKYNLVDVNDYTEEELLKEKTFLSKAMLIESKKDTEKIVDYLDKIIDIVNKEKEYTQEQRNLLSKILDIVLRIKIKDNEITNKLIRKIKKERSDNMLAIIDTIEEENRRILNRGIKKGKKEGRKEVAKILKQKSISIELIKEATGLSEEEIEKL